MSVNYKILEYADELLADKTICRRYSDGLIEWRQRLDDGRIEWRDNHNRFGTDELLGDEIIKRSFAAENAPVYGREQGYGRTLWSSGILTVNKTSFPGRVGAALAAVGGAMLLGSLIAPPITLAAEEEAELRRRAAQQRSSSGGGDNNGSSSGDSESSVETEGDWDKGGGAGGDWDDAGDFGDADGDFG